MKNPILDPNTFHEDKKTNKINQKPNQNQIIHYKSNESFSSM